MDREEKEKKEKREIRGRGSKKRENILPLD